MDNVSNVYVVRKVSVKEGKVPFNWYQCYTEYEDADGYLQKCIISMDVNAICQIFDVTTRALASLEKDVPQKLGELKLGGE